MARRHSGRISDMEDLRAAHELFDLRKAPSGFAGHDVHPFDPLTKLAKSIYGDDVVDAWVSSRRKVRDIWENAEVSAQCVNTIGPYGQGENKTCWLCGLAFDPTKEALKPICEHILPIAQAVFFLELYAKSKGQSLSKENVPEVMSLEYGWGHAICNSIKSGSIFIRPADKGGAGFVKTDTLVISNYLAKLVTTPSKLEGVDQIKAALYTPQQYQIAKDSITSKIDKIVEFINRPDKEFSGLLLLARSSSYVDATNVNKTFAGMVGIPPSGGKSFRRKHNGKSIRRATAKGNGSDSRTRRKVRTSNRKRT